MGEIGNYVYIRFVKPILYEDSVGGKYVLQSDLDQLNLSDTERDLLMSVLSTNDITITKDITKDDRSKRVVDFEYGGISEASMNPADKNRIAQVNYDSKGEVSFSDFTILDNFLRDEFIPENIQIKVRYKDKIGPEYYSIQLNKIVKLRLSEIEFKHVLDYLKKQKIIVCGTSEYPENEFENYDYFYRIKNIQIPNYLSSDETLDLFYKMQECNDVSEKSKIRNQIIVGNMRLAKWALFKMSSYYDLNSEWDSYAYEGLIKAVDEFNVDLGYRFSTFAVVVIQNFIRNNLAKFYGINTNIFPDFVRAMKVVEKKEGKKYKKGDTETLKKILGLLVNANFISDSLRNKYLKDMTPPISYEDEELLNYTDDENVEQSIYNELLNENLNEVLNTLTDREAKVLKLRSGLYDGCPKSLEETGQIFDVSRERIRQIEAKALRKLRHPSRSKKIISYLDPLDGYEMVYKDDENEGKKPEFKDALEELDEFYREEEKRKR